MKRILNLMFIAVVACGAETVASQEAAIQDTVARGGEASLSIAALGQAVERHAAAEAQPARKAESFLYKMGLTGHGPFPSRGGPIDD